jgi:hypothetical protein
VDGMTSQVDEYLSQLRASLRTRPEETSWILAEAEDHLRESVAAALCAGMTQVEAQQAAVSAFGSVRSVVRAQHPVGRLPGVRRPHRQPGQLPGGNRPGHSRQRSASIGQADQRAGADHRRIKVSYLL